MKNISKMIMLLMIGILILTLPFANKEDEIDLEIKINEVTDDYLIGEPFFNEVSSDGKIFKVIFVEIKNKNNEKVKFKINDFILKANNSEYKAMTTEIFLDDLLYHTEISPNSSVKGVVVFEIPENSIEADLIVKKEVINLNWEKYSI